MRYLITGGCGFLGSNISKKIIELGHDLIIFDNLSRYGSMFNKNWLEKIGDYKLIIGDIRDKDLIVKIYKRIKTRVYNSLSSASSHDPINQRARIRF
jgi:CDP-paratose 2-epimerase